MYVILNNIWYTIFQDEESYFILNSYIETIYQADSHFRERIDSDLGKGVILTEETLRHILIFFLSSHIPPNPLISPIIFQTQMLSSQTLNNFIILALVRLCIIKIFFTIFFIIFICKATLENSYVCMHAFM